MFKAMTQGGQVHIHQLRMFKQIFVFGFIVAFLSGGLYFGWACWRMPWGAAYEVGWAKLLLATTSEVKHSNMTQAYTPPSALKLPAYKRRCLDVVADISLKQKIQELKMELKSAAYKALFCGGLAFFILGFFWLKRGGSHKETLHQRGVTFMHWTQLAKRLRQENQASDLMIENFPLIKNKETSHILITGTTGSGKSNLFHSLVPQIRQRGNKAIIVDVTGDYMARYYDEATDLILNPLDTRSLSWDPWADCQLDSHYDVLADSLIQPKGRSNADPFWDNASRAVLKTALRKMAAIGNPTVEALYHLLMTSSDKEFCRFFKNTEAAPHASEENEKTTSSIRSVLSSQLEGLRQLESDQGVESADQKAEGSRENSEDPSQNSKSSFSLRDWIADERHKGWLFITARADQRQAFIPLISAWVDIATNALMTLPGNTDRRLWFVIDELIALQKLPGLQIGLAEARKYGGCFLIGFQGKSQMESLYGQKEADAMLDLFNTKIFFRSSEPATQQWISKTIGDKEEAEPNENISYGANTMRDGVTFGRNLRQKALIMPSEFSQLRDLECYIKLPGDYPCTKLQMSLTSLPKPEERQMPFLLKPEKKREYSVSPAEPEKIQQEPQEGETKKAPQ